LLWRVFIRGIATPSVGNNLLPSALIRGMRGYQVHVQLLSIRGIRVDSWVFQKKNFAHESRRAGTNLHE
jgi:hypothetical protein